MEPNETEPAAEKSLTDAECSEVESSGEKKRHRRHEKIGIIAAAAVVIVAAGFGAAAAANQPTQASDVPTVSAQATASAEEQDEKSDVLLTVEAEGAQAGATKAKVMAVDDENRITIAEMEIEANVETNIGQLPAGSYELYVTAAPVCEDGSSYKLPDEPVAFTVAGDGLSIPVSVKLDKLAVDDMTKEQMEAAAGVLEASGKADAAKGVRDKAQSAPSAPGSADAIVSGHETSGTSPSATPSTQPSAGGNSGDGGSGSTPTPEQHTHSWAAATEQRWVPNNVWVEDGAAWDETVKTGSHILCSCDATFGTNADWSNHNMENLAAGGGGHSYSTEVEYETIHHEATGHYEDQGHYETVTTGYKCSCGATK